LTIDQIIELQKIEYIYNKCLPRSIISKKNVQSSKKDFIHIITCYPNHLAS